MTNVLFSLKVPSSTALRKISQSSFVVLLPCIRFVIGIAAQCVLSRE